MHNKTSSILEAEVTDLFVQFGQLWKEPNKRRCESNSLPVGAACSTCCLQSKVGNTADDQLYQNPFAC